MSEELRNLVKVMILYRFVQQTDNRTKAVNDLKSKLRSKLRQVLKTSTSLFNEADKLQTELYQKAWDNTKPDEQEGRYIYLGFCMQRIRETIDDKVLRKYVGLKVYDRAEASYFYADSAKTQLTIDEERRTEDDSNLLSDEIIRLIDGDVKRNKLSTLKKTLEFNKILEGK